MAVSAQRWRIAVGAVLLLVVGALVQLWSSEPPPPADPQPQAMAQPRPMAEAAPARHASSAARRDPATRIVTIRLGDLRRDCFASSHAGPRYAGEPITKFSIRIPTNSKGPVPFDFCVQEIRFDDALAPWGRGGVFDAERNELGLSGPWFHFGDDVTTWERPAPGQVLGETVGPGAPLCIKGSAAQVFENRFDDYWGAALGFHFVGSPGEVPLYQPAFATLQLLLQGRQIPTRLGFYVDDDRGQGTPFRTWCELTR
jgi:hypothetical protein